MIRKRLAVIFIVFVVVVLVCLLGRNAFLQYAFKRAQARILTDYSLVLNAKEVSFSAFDVVDIRDVTAMPLSGDTFARIEEILVNISVVDLLKARIGFDEVKISRALITVFSKPQSDSVHFSKVPATSDPTQQVTGNYLAKLNSLNRKLLRAFNTAFELNDIEVQYRDSAISENIFIPLLKYDLDSLTGTLINKAIKDTFLLNGKALAKGKQYSFAMVHTGDSLRYLPFLNWDRKLKCRFKSLKVAIALEEVSGNMVTSLQCNAEQFHLNHWRLANDDVVFEQASFNGKLKVAESGIELDSSSVVKLKNLSTNVFASYSLSNADTTFTFRLQMPETASDTFFHALPEGMFNTLKGISCTGSLQYDLLFSINTSQPDSLIFSSSLSRKNFGIVHYGTENYGRINGPFTYHAYDKDRFVRNIEISAANPGFTPLNHISEYLIHSVLQSEDPSFMLHRGFLPESFRESVVKNYKERRFARGGSTISMQLVKNVFLSRDKTVSRKVEEALIVYLIENLHLVPKERMLEVYLNAIEWGPGVYGIGEASHFYFNKRPAELNLQESVFLAGIIPAPKYFKYQFDKEGKLKPYLSGYFRILTGRMVMKGWISPADTSGLTEVNLKGPALRLVVPSDDPIPEMEPEDY